MTHEEFVGMLIASGWKMDAFGHYVKQGRKAVVRIRGEEVDFGRGWQKLSDAKLSEDGRSIIWNGR